MNLFVKVQADSLQSFRMDIPHLSNIKNSKMNNVCSIDFAIREWQDDTDMLLPRYGSEFPRLSNSYTSRADIKNRPWGANTVPQHFNASLDSIISSLN